MDYTKKTSELIESLIANTQRYTIGIVNITGLL